MTATPYIVGVVLALLVAAFARSVGFDRDRAFYPVVMIVIAAYYVLFAVMGGSTRALLVEAAIMTVFVVLAVAGFRKSLWLVVAALAAHGVLDLLHPRLVANPGVPAWWPAWCMAYDVTAAAVLAFLVARATKPAGLAAAPLNADASRRT